MEDSTSPLLELPVELRNQIYGYLFSEKTWHLADPNEPYQSAVLLQAEDALPQIQKTSVFQDLRAALAIIVICRKIHGEARLLPFADATFCIDAGPSYAAFEPWLTRRTTEQQSLIKRIEVSISLVQWQDRDMKDIRPWPFPVLVPEPAIHSIGDLMLWHVSSIHVNYITEYRQEYYDPVEGDGSLKLYNAVEWIEDFEDMMFVSPAARRIRAGVNITTLCCQTGNEFRCW